MLILDLDGVLRRWDAGTMLEAERRGALPEGALSTAAFSDTGRLHAAITGRITDQQWRQAIPTNLRRPTDPKPVSPSNTGHEAAGPTTSRCSP